MAAEEVRAARALLEPHAQGQGLTLSGPAGTALPPQAEHLGPLVGTWVGQGEGLWTPEDPFRYREEVTFAAVGKPFLAYRQQTWALDDDRPMHAEVGYLRAVGGRDVELLIVQPTGFTEVHVGTMVDGRLSLTAHSLSRSPSALAVTAIERSWSVTADTVCYLVRMAMNGEALADHLRGRLLRC